MNFRTLATTAAACTALAVPASAASVFEATVTDAGGFDVVAAPGSSFPANHAFFTGTIFGGEGIAISGVENFSGMLAGGGLMTSLSFDIYEPTRSTAALEGCNTICVDSTFAIDFLLNGVVQWSVGNLMPADDLITNFFFSAASPFDAFRITEVVGSNDNEFFANFRAELAPVPLPAGGALLLGALGLLALRRRG